ncbi:MAG TPA: hypothetical protein VFZ65_04605 [Planctomycetota bacterium]|nr:hypothetical protein [Planctomycetota bacterium]
MKKLTYVKHERFSLKDSSEFTEKWLQDQITKDPTVLGLPGQPFVLDRERRQERAGRLDLLLHDQDTDRRYELELMLGSLDESHIIRSLEYWDIERRRYPGYDHVAVIVAEDVTGRFLNILSLLAGTIPMIVLQCNALHVEGNLVLDFVKVLDQTSLRRDDEEAARAEPATHDYWVERVGEAMVKLCERSLAMLNEHAKSPFTLNHNRQYIGLSDGSRSRNFVHFIPKKKFVHVKAAISDAETWVERLAGAGLEVRTSDNGTMVRVTVLPQDFGKNEGLLRELLTKAVQEYEG